MKIFYTDHFVLPLPPEHRFPMLKYAQLRQRIVETQLVPLANLSVPTAATDAQLALVHSKDYIERVKTGNLTPQAIRKMGFPWSPGLVERSRRSVGATIAASQTALQDGVGVNLAGGTHHAFVDMGQGFCVFNDVAVASRVLQQNGQVKRVIIIDCDVHQGNGTAAIFAHDSTVFTFSIHGAKNFPFRKEQSDLDIGLPDKTGDEIYLQSLQDSLKRALPQTQADFAIYLAGADPYQGDRLGRLALSKAGLATRDKVVFEQCQQIGIPVAVVMSGGYAPNIDDIVDIHYQTVKTALAYYAR